MELYVTNPHARQVKSDPALQELSETLRGLDLGLPRPDAAEFRNLNGCYMKLQNFKAIDPAYPGKGLRRGVTKRMEGLWARFAEDTEALREAASTIRADKGQVLRSQDIAADPEDEAVLEGKVLYLIHRIRERRRGPEKKKRVLSETGRLECEVCGFDFRRTYGSTGGFRGVPSQAAAQCGRAANPPFRPGHRLFKLPSHASSRP
jgi:5-methylcytosine-specific restriction protein A